MISASLTATAIEGAALGGELAATFVAASEEHRIEALHRTAVLRREDELRASGIRGDAAHAQLRHEYGVPRRNLFRWRKCVRGAHPRDWPALLLPSYRSARTSDEIDPDAWQHFLSDYHRASTPAFSACYERLTRAALARGWTVPSEKSLRRRYKREVSPSSGLIRRRGVEAYEALLPTQTRDKSELEALEWVNADGHRLDVFVRWPMRDGSPGRITRPTLLAWQDIYSGKILSWRIDETENADAVRLAFADMVREYGLPEHAVIDNGHAFASRQMTGGMLGKRFRFKVTPREYEGIYRSLDVQPHPTLPYRGRSKPIERAFKDLCETVSRHPFCAGAYTGNAPHHRPEDYGERAIPIEDFIPHVAREIAAHNARPGRRSANCAGRSLDETFAASYEQLTVRRVATERQLQWLLMPIDGVRVPASGQCVIRLLGNAFFAPELLELRGQTVAVRFDPHDLHAGLYVFAPGALEPTCHAECIARVGFGDTDAARRTERARRAMVRAKKAEAAAFGTVPVHELTIEPAALPELKRKGGRVVSADFRPAQRAPKGASPDAQRRELEAQSEDLCLEIGRAALAELNAEFGLVQRK